MAAAWGRVRDILPRRYWLCPGRKLALALIQETLQDKRLRGLFHPGLTGSFFQPPQFPFRDNGFKAVFTFYIFDPYGIFLELCGG